MNTTTQGAAAGSGAAALAIVGILCGILAKYNITISADMSNDMVVLITIIIHYFVGRSMTASAPAQVIRVTPVGPEQRPAPTTAAPAHPVQIGG